MIEEIPIKKINDRKTFCNRKWFNEKQIEKLIDSIKRIGLQNPVIIRNHPTNDEYQLIAGENRLRALESLGKEKVLTRIVELSDEEASAWSFESNLFHEEGQLHPIEQGYYFKKLSANGMSHEKIGKKFKISAQTVKNYLVLTKLSFEMQDIFVNKMEKFNLGQALQIARLATYGGDVQKKVWNELQKIRDSRKRTIEALEKIVNRKIKEIELEKARIKELEEILSLYWDQTLDVIAEFRSRFEKLGYNNDQIRSEIIRLNERHQLLVEIESNDEIDMEFITELKEWVDNNNPSNYSVRQRVKDYLEERKEEEAKASLPVITQTVYIKSSEHMEDVEDETVHLVVTSPPYWNLKNYGNQIKQIGYLEAYEDYITRLYQVLKECIRVLVPGGRICFNVGDVFTSSEHFGRYKVMAIHSKVIEFCETNGMDYMNTIFWKKIGKSEGGGGIKGGIFGSYPFPPNGIINNDIEYILTFKKSGERIKPPPEIIALSKFDKSEWMEHFSQIWEIIPASQRKGHPAVFPELLPRRLIRMFTFEGETVLDPFLGTSTTLKVAREMNRHSIGYEINSKYVTLVKEKCPYAKIVDIDGSIIQNK
ncbi:MAG: DNA methyltransferase [Promethearchaeota archaeon]|jgi:ParB/RepB/Spo0J family partition protein